MKIIKEIIKVDSEVIVYVSDDGKVKSSNQNRVINYEHSQRYKTEEFSKKYQKQRLCLNNMNLDVYYIPELSNEVNLDFNNFYEHNATCNRIQITQTGWIGIQIEQSDYTSYYIYELKDLLEEYKTDIQKLENIINA